MREQAVVSNGMVDLFGIFGNPHRGTYNSAHLRARKPG